MRALATASLALLFAAAAASNPAGLAFLQTNAEKEGVVSLPSGLQYKVVREGKPDGKRPLVGTPCECHYSGRLIDGTEFDSSYKRGSPTTFAPNQVIAGWTEAMQLMTEGSKWELTIPSELAYGNSARGAHIKPGAVLVFDLELLKVKGAYASGPAPATPKATQKPEPSPSPEPEAVAAPEEKAPAAEAAEEVAAEEAAVSEAAAAAAEAETETEL